MQIFFRKKINYNADRDNQEPATSASMLCLS